MWPTFPQGCSHNTVFTGTRVHCWAARWAVAGRCSYQRCPSAIHTGSQREANTSSSQATVSYHTALMTLKDLSKTNSHFSSPFTFLLLPPSLPVSLPLRLPLSPTLFLPSIQLQDDINHNGLEVLSIYVQKYIDILSKSECKSYTPIFVCTSSSPSVFDHRGRPGIWQEHIRMGD